jgi:hypothetical protein
MSNLKENLKIIKSLTKIIKNNPDWRFQQILWSCGIIGRNYNDQDELEIEDRFYENSETTLKRVDEFLKNNENRHLEYLHSHCLLNKEELERGIKCTCFYCSKEFNFSEIKEWTDNSKTAICPHCGIDSVISNSLGFTKDEINKLNKKYFKNK